MISMIWYERCNRNAGQSKIRDPEDLAKHAAASSPLLHAPKSTVTLTLAPPPLPDTVAAAVNQLADSPHAPTKTVVKILKRGEQIPIEKNPVPIESKKADLEKSSPMMNRSVDGFYAGSGFFT
ncbi:hypothetical protein LINPERHAP1_LOCUS15544 [Linum perenne]